MLILLQRGFSMKWCDWMLDILSSGKSHVLLNGVLGPWVTCKFGLRQGDPISPIFSLLSLTSYAISLIPRG